ncbi:MAG: asparagine synthase-related protein [Pseudomonadota bacterium]|nr:asparagine synthase-related protein [Pseudomonadota bacterium]
MSIFAGVLVRRAGQVIPAKLIDELSASVSRYPGEDAGNRTEFTDDSIFIVKVDVGALAERGGFSNSDMIAFVAGDPILQRNTGALPVSRAESLQTIALDLAAGQDDALRSCRGTYCAAVYERSHHRLHLMTDKLGVRPVYCWVSPDYIVFATALRILEAVSFCKKSLDLQGIAETACFGYPLSDRTPYENVFSLHAGEVVSSDAAGLRRRQYWRWDELPVPAASDTAPAERLYKLFIDAIQLRLRGQKVVAAFLSGGLDSRAVVAALKGEGVDVFTANFGSPTSQDRVLGKLAADRLGTRYSHLELRPLLVEDDGHSHVSIRDWLSSAEYLAHSPQRPRVVWAGDGGSLGLGHIYLNADIVTATRGGDLREATAKFLAYNRWGLQAKLLKRQLATTFADLVNDGISAELESIHPSDRGRIFYLFLMLNDQRRHMFNHFENLDLTRTELEMPFFDGEFIAGVLREPIDSFLRHVFYLEWLKCFPQAVLEIPWQAYPNHAPCPLPQPEGLTYQWDRESYSEQEGERRRAALNGAQALLRESDFSHEYLSYGHMRLFKLLIQWGKADRSYLMHVPSVIYRYWSRTTSANKEKRNE